MYLTMEGVLMEIRERFSGKWKVDRDENFEEFLRALDISYLLRKLMVRVKLDCVITVKDDKINILMNAGPIKSNHTFKLHEEFEYSMHDTKRKATATYQDGALIIDMIPYDSKHQPLQHIREIVDGELVMTLKMKEVEAKRYFKRRQ